MGWGMGWGIGQGYRGRCEGMHCKYIQKRISSYCLTRIIRRNFVMDSCVQDMRSPAQSQPLENHNSEAQGFSNGCRYEGHLTVWSEGSSFVWRLDALAVPRCLKITIKHPSPTIAHSTAQKPCQLFKLCYSNHQGIIHILSPPPSHTHPVPIPLAIHPSSNQPIPTVHPPPPQSPSSLSPPIRPPRAKLPILHPSPPKPSPLLPIPISKTHIREPRRRRIEPRRRGHAVGAVVEAREQAGGEGGVGDAHLMEAWWWLDGWGLALLLVLVVILGLGLLVWGREHVETWGAVGERGKVVVEAGRRGLGFAVRGFVVRDVGEETGGWAGVGGLLLGGVWRDEEVLEGEAGGWGAAGEGGLGVVFGGWLGGAVGLGLLH